MRAIRWAGGARDRFASSLLIKPQTGNIKFVLGYAGESDEEEWIISIGFT